MMTCISKNRKVLTFLGAALFFSVLLASPLFSASAIKGTITDKKTGEPLEKVKISIQSLRTATAQFEVHTDKKGYFYKSGLQNGMYRISLDKDGFVPTSTTIRLRVSDQLKFDTSMEPMVQKAAATSFSLVARAKSLLAAGKVEEAIEKVTEAVEKDPSNFILYFNRAIAYDRKGDSVKAAADYKKSLDLKPDFLLSLAALGKYYAKKADFETAVGYYSKAFKLEISDTMALYNYGACLVNLGKTDDAKTVFEKIVELDPTYADAYYQLGIIYLGLNQNDKAKEFLEKFVELDPENTNAAVAKEILNTL